MDWLNSFSCTTYEIHLSSNVTAKFYEEGNPGWGYDGAECRVCLKKFGYHQQCPLSEQLQNEHPLDIYTTFGCKDLDLEDLNSLETLNCGSKSRGSIIVDLKSLALIP